MRYLYEPLKKATKFAVEDLRQDGGVGGVIALDRKGKGVYLCRSHLVISTNSSMQWLWL
jgi:hypothetical protein